LKEFVELEGEKGRNIKVDKGGRKMEVRRCGFDFGTRRTRSSELFATHTIQTRLRRMREELGDRSSVGRGASSAACKSAFYRAWKESRWLISMTTARRSADLRQPTDNACET